MRNITRRFAASHSAAFSAKSPNDHFKRARALEKQADNYQSNHQMDPPKLKGAALLHAADLYQLAADHYRMAGEPKDADHIEATYVETFRHRAAKLMIQAAQGDLGDG